MRNNIRIIIGALVIIGLIALVVYIVRNARQAPAEQPASQSQLLFVTPSTSDSSTEIPTAEVIPTVGVSIPAPRTSESYSNKPYDGIYLGTLAIANGLTYKVYEAVLTNGSVEIPDNGLAYWQGNFIGHLIQNSGWLLVNTKEKLTWTPSVGTTIIFTVGEPERTIGFNGVISPLPMGQFKLVTCYVDFANSTAQHRVFGGNIFYGITAQ